MRWVRPSMGLGSALDALVVRSPVDLRVVVPERLDAAIEAAAYFLVSDALTNVARYGQPNALSVDVEATACSLIATVTDDGVGGADPARGSGLRGLIDRVQAVGGQFDVVSPPDHGTRLCARLPTNVRGSLNGASGATSA